MTCSFVVSRPAVALLGLVTGFFAIGLSFFVTHCTVNFVLHSCYNHSVLLAEVVTFSFFSFYSFFFFWLSGKDVSTCVMAETT